MPPRELQRRLTQAGGKNLYGEPNFRVVWGWSRLEWMGGRWGVAERGPIEYRREPKYMPPDRWIIEAWYPAEHYGSPASWAYTTHATIEGKHVEQMGPYPAHGDYEHVATIQTKDGGYAVLTPTICDMIVDLVRSNQDIRRGARKSLILAEEEKKDRRWDSEADSILNDMPSFHLKPHIIVPGRKEAA